MSGSRVAARGREREWACGQLAGGASDIVRGNEAERVWAWALAVKAEAGHSAKLGCVGARVRCGGRA